jgi:hypothetical protein
VVPTHMIWGILGGNPTWATHSYSTRIKGAFFASCACRHSAAISGRATLLRDILEASALT